MSDLSRVPSTSGARLMNVNLESSYRRLVQLQDQLSSGKQLRVPSDDPASTVQALDTRTQLRRNTQFDRNMTDGKDWLNAADSSLTTAQDYLNRVRDLSIQARSGSLSNSARGAIANEIDSLNQSLVQLANTHVGNRAIFAGTGNTSTPIQTNGQPDPAANTNAVLRPVASGVNVQVNVGYDTLFGNYVGTAGGDYTGNTFEVITKLANDIRNPSAPGANVVAGQTALDTARDRMANAQAIIGSRSQRLDDIQARNTQENLQLTSNLSTLEDIDVPKTIIDVQTQQMAYQAALSATAKVIQPSLVDFLR
jgi:flagellar hook-associated protein 3 FlgL